MMFGHIDTDPDEIDFTLPDDPIVTTETLRSAGSDGDFQVYVGASKWSEKRWIGKIYPPKTPEKDFLGIYANNFKTIEFSPTFYNIYKPEEIEKWAKTVEGAPGFRFLPKFPQMISHIRRLTNAEKPTALFYESLNAFGNHLGPLLLQLGDNFTPKSFPQLKLYLESLPPTIKVAIEVRHKDWFAITAHRDDLFTLLNKLNISWVMSDTMGRRDCVHMHLPTPHAIIRFVGNDLNHTDYTRINTWVERFAEWKDQGLQSIWFYVHQMDEAAVPELCDYLIKQLNEKLGTTIKVPNLIKD